MSYHDDFRAARQEYYWTLPRVLGVMFLTLVAFTLFGWAACAVGLIGGAGQNAAKVIQKEFYPEALLAKYTWFKDASAALDKKLADISVYNNRIALLRADFQGIPRAQWPRDVREQLAIWESEASGVKASYNSLAAEYNAAMAKFNWRFTNVGDLPPGATTPLPREYKPYITE